LTKARARIRAQCPASPNRARPADKLRHSLCCRRQWLRLVPTRPREKEESRMKKGSCFYALEHSRDFLPRFGLRATGSALQNRLQQRRSRANPEETAHRKKTRRSQFRWDRRQKFLYFAPLALAG